MHKSKTDLAVLILFFARPNTLEKVFESVKKARPSKLFLACDGPRKDHPDDVASIERCKQIVEDIDWECEVYRHYAEENRGCGKGPADGISWAFTYVDKLLILEDDCVADESLFPFMEQMLLRYEKDERIGMISGFNHMKNWNCGGNSYCFTKTGATLGWGTWRRVWEKYDFYVSNIRDDHCQKLLTQEFPREAVARRRIDSWRAAWEATRKGPVNYWDVQFGFLKYSQSYLCVVPKNNLIYNIGVGPGSTHTEKNREQVWKKGRVLFMPTQALEFPLVHPNYVICDRDYDEETMKIIFPGSISKILRRVKRVLGL